MKPLLFPFLAAAALTACTTLGSLVRGYHDIDQAELQARIETRFPLQRCKLAVACLNLAHPLVVLQEGDDRIGFVAEIRIVLGTRERSGRIGLSGRPRYAPEEGQLYLDDVQITTFELAGFPEDYVDFVKANGGALARQALQSRPVYSLDAETSKGAFAKRTVRDVRVVNGRLRLSFRDLGE